MVCVLLKVYVPEPVLVIVPLLVSPFCIRILGAPEADQVPLFVIPASKYLFPVPEFTIVAPALIVVAPETSRFAVPMVELPPVNIKEPAIFTSSVTL